MRAFILAMLIVAALGWAIGFPVDAAVAAVETFIAEAQQ